MSAPPVESAADRLLALHRSGQVAARYPEIRALLAGLPEEELARAGRLLSRLDPDDVLREHPAQPRVTIAVTGNGTLSGLVPLLTAELARHGVVLRPQVGDFGTYVADLSDPDGAFLAAGADLVLCVLDPAAVTDDLPTPWRIEDARRVLEEKVALLERLADRFAERGGGRLVLNTLPLTREITAQLVDGQSRAALGAAWREANARLLDLVRTRPGVAVVDLDPIIADGVPALDVRLGVYTKARLSPGLLAGYAREVGHLARQVVGRTKKCLVLDLDETVWGGVLGDDGPEGIEVADTYRGEAFRAFQRVAKQLAAQGVLLAAVSKNDLDPVRRALRDHPRMTLREEDFVRVVANWRPKHENLRELADDLNLGVDSFVFVDDSPYERGLVARELPDVAVVAVDDEPAWHVTRLLRDGWFDTPVLTGEDQHRPARYREELVRKDFLNSFDTLTDYLRELGVWVVLEPANEQSSARVSQMTLRTNQFNLTTRRLPPADVQALMADPGATVLTVESGDRFGGNGVVGAIFTHREGAVVHIDNFLLSCRVFSRGIEQAALSAVLRHAAATGAEAVVGTYLPTAKNGKVADFYPRHGFTAVDATTFRHDLTDIPPVPGHIDLTENLGGDPS